jgi:transcriptional regulator with GAF, ATPase, and Fis domain
VDAVGSRELRLRALFDAGVLLSSDLSLDSLLQRVVRLAAELTGARYGALGVIDESGRQLERFVTHGVSAETEAAIGSFPRGRGVLGVLIAEASPLRLHELGEDPRSVGFPPGHPPMHSFLGVPVMLRGVAYGNLYLTEKAGGEDFSDEDEELLTLLAGQAAVAIENARLYEAATRWSRQLQSLNEVGNALATETDLGTLLDLVARRLRGSSTRDSSSCSFLPAPTSFASSPLRAKGRGLVGQTAAAVGVEERTRARRRRSERVGSVIDDPEVNQELTRRLGARTGLWVPLLVRRA